MSASYARISVLTIGDELLTGEVIDTNLTSIAKAVGSLGLVVSRHLTIGDDIEVIVRAVDELCAQSDALVVTGGLGPTSDDLTCESVAAAAGRELEFHPHLEENLRSFFDAMGRPMVVENLKQAYLPRGSVEIPAAGGTASGFMLEHDGALVAVLPGVPREMEEMLDAAVLPELEKRFGGGEVTVTGRVMTFGAGESDVAHLVADLMGKSVVRYGFLAQSGPIVVKLTATGGCREDALALVEAERSRVVERLGPLVYGIDDETMEENVGRLLRASGLKLAVAESLTAGMVCSRIVNVPGSSDYFLGGVVTYSIAAKHEVLGLSAGLLRDGAVKEEVALAMAVSVREMYSADIGVSTTGIAGPGAGKENKPPGTACVALVHEDKRFSLERRLPGNRQMVRDIATMAALNTVRLHVLQLR